MFVVAKNKKLMSSVSPKDPFGGAIYIKIELIKIFKYR